MKGAPITAGNSWLLHAFITVVIITNYMVFFTCNLGKYFTTAKFLLASLLSLFVHQEEPKVEMLSKRNSAWYNRTRESKNSHNANSWKFVLVHNMRNNYISVKLISTFCFKNSPWLLKLWVYVSQIQICMHEDNMKMERYISNHEL